jgi:hypothetical protein
MLQAGSSESARNGIEKNESGSNDALKNNTRKICVIDARWCRMFLRGPVKKTGHGRLRQTRSPPPSWLFRRDEAAAELTVS